jgi:ABC-2 type transport system ATP-binding protein
MHKDILFEAVNLSKTFRGQKAIFSNISFKVERGLSYGLLGKNGQGKSTLLKVILSNIKATSGEVIWRGEHKSKRKICYIPEKVIFRERMTGRQYASTVGKMALDDKNWAKIADQFYCKFGLNVFFDRPMCDYSKGMLQKLLIYAGILSGARIYILDEPFSGLDIGTRKELRELIQEIRKEGATIIFTSHQIEEVCYLCDKALILKDGRLQERERLSFFENRNFLGVDEDGKELKVEKDLFIDNKRLIQVKLKSTLEELI